MKKPDTDHIYNKKAHRYDILISKEDYKNNMFESLNKITSFENKDIIDLGAGTGRLSCMLAPMAKTIKAFDSSKAMLEVAAKKLKKLGHDNWEVLVADHREIPVATESADIVVAGWSLFYLGKSSIKDWKKNINEVMDEIERVLRVNGIVIILETLGTGNKTPEIPDNLAGYYQMLETHYGFKHRWIRTDYKFKSLEEAEKLTRFFFGDELADRVVKEELKILPECTGIWWLE